MEDGFLPTKPECQPNVLHHENLLYAIRDLMSRTFESSHLECAGEDFHENLKYDNHPQTSSFAQGLRPRFYQNSRNINIVNYNIYKPCIICDYVNFLFNVEHRKYTFNFNQMMTGLSVKD